MDKLEVNEIFNTIYDMDIIKLAFSNLTAINIIVICLNTLYNKHRFDMIDRRFDMIDRRFEQVDRRFEQIGSDVSELKKQMNNIENMMKLLLEHNE